MGVEDKANILFFTYHQDIPEQLIFFISLFGSHAVEK